MGRSLLLGTENLPKAMSLRRLLGPSFILLGLGLGSGEVVLWPTMTSAVGLGVVWGMVVGITMQAFINMEVVRYALIYGESVFVGFARIVKGLPLWFIISTFLGFGWPGIGLYGATLLSRAFGIGHPDLTGVVVFLAIGLILSLGPVLYRTVEKIQMLLIGIGVPFIIILALMLADAADLWTLLQGLIGKGEIAGEPYWFLPEGIALTTFLAALAYSGAGGNLNLTQSCYVRDKGYGMGTYAQKITSLITSGASRKTFKLTGHTFPLTPANLRNFRGWWKVVNTEHFLVFWGLGLFTMLTLSLLAYVTTHGEVTGAKGILFVVSEAEFISASIGAIFGFLFLIATGVMLCATQLTILDSTSRIMTENVLLLTKGDNFNVSRVYYGILWIQILFGILVFLMGFDQPLSLIVLGAVINAFSMFVYTGILLYMNNTVLSQELRPALWRNAVLGASFLFLGFFCAFTFWAEIVG